MGTDTFLGFRRPDGRAGVRNHVLILSPTGLTARAAARIGSLVQGPIVVASGYGRGQVGADAKLQFETLTGLARNPNVAATLVLAAGSDIVASYEAAIAASGKPVRGFSLPDAQEDALRLVDLGVRAATQLVREASALRREACRVGELCVAVECGHSDATSGLVCNPLAGALTEYVVGQCGQAMFSETIEWTGAEHLLARRAVSAEVADAIARAVARREQSVHHAGGDVRAQNPGPQNKAGGLTTIEEKALGAIAKGGRQPIHGLLQPAERPAAPGLYLMDTPFFSPESITAMVAAGAQLVLFTTGAGNSYCSLVAPTLKMSAHPDTCARLAEQIDIAAGDVVSGAATLEQATTAGIARLLDVASGTLTYGEIVGEGSEVVSRIGPSM
jgi:altronate dehydratase large subunit